MECIFIAAAVCTILAFIIEVVRIILRRTRRKKKERQGSANPNRSLKPAPPETSKPLPGTADAIILPVFASSVTVTGRESA